MSKQTKQTAVEWLAEQILHPNSFNPYIEQALAMEKEQIEDAKPMEKKRPVNPFYLIVFSIFAVTAVACGIYGNWEAAGGWAAAVYLMIWPPKRD